MTQLNNEGPGEFTGGETGGGPGGTDGNEVFGSPAFMGPGFPATVGDMRFLGYTVIVMGVLNCLTILGALVGVPLVIAGMRALDASTRLEEFRTGGGTGPLSAGFHELGRSLRILKILVIIYIVLTVLYFVGLFFFGGLAMLASLAESGGY